MTDAELAKVLIEKLLDWPFLFFLLIVGGLFAFRSQVAGWVSRVSEIELGEGKLKFKIGKDEVPLEKLDATITARLRELQEELEQLRNEGGPAQQASAPRADDTSTEIPSTLTEILAARVYPMLESNLWLGRYVATLARAAAVTEDTMLKFCRSRNDIGLFKDGDRWVAALAQRLKRHS